MSSLERQKIETIYLEEEMKSSYLDYSMSVITNRALPVLDNMEYITARVKGITDSIDDQVVAVRDSIASVKQVAENVVEMERKVQERIEGPILETVALVSAVFKGVRTFFDRVRA